MNSKYKIEIATKRRKNHKKKKILIENLCVFCLGNRHYVRVGGNE